MNFGHLRQYFPKGTDLGIHSAEDRDWVAAELNDQPRKRRVFRTLNAAAEAKRAQETA